MTEMEVFMKTTRILWVGVLLLGACGQDHQYAVTESPEASERDRGRGGVVLTPMDIGGEEGAEGDSTAALDEPVEGQANPADGDDASPPERLGETPAGDEASEGATDGATDGSATTPPHGPRTSFEQQPLHGTFLLDKTGLVRWQDISYEPFTDTEFLLKETKRLLGQKFKR